MKKIRCKNCKFWKRVTQFELTEHKAQKLQAATKKIDGYSEIIYDNSEVYKSITIPNSPLGKCSNKNFIYTQAGGCDDIDLKIALKNTQTLLYSDGEAYQAYFYTTENFGCIHFISSTPSPVHPTPH